MPSCFNGRTWELKYIKSIDILDSLASNIRLAISSNNIVSILPNLDNYYDEWITNKARFIYDSFNIQRLYYPKLKLFFKFIILSWKLVLLLFLNLLLKKYKQIINIYSGPYLSLDLALVLKSFFYSFGGSQINYWEPIYIYCDLRYSYLLNNSILNISKLASILLLGCNPRLEVPLLNAYLRKNFLNNSNFKVFSIGGLGLDYITYPVINLGNSINSLINIIFGLSLVSKYFLLDNYYSIYLLNYNNSLITLHFFLGGSSLIRKDSNSFLNIFLFFLFKFKLPINYINIIQRYLGRISYSEIYLQSFLNKKLIKFNEKYSDFNYLIGIDNNPIKKKNLYKNFCIFQGFFYISNLFKEINLILPTSIYVEQISSYINLEGRYRNTNKAITAFKFIFLDINIIKSFSIFLYKFYLNYFSIFLSFFFINNKFKYIINYFKNYLINLNNYINLYEKNIFLIKNIFFSFYSKNYNTNKIYNTIFSKLIYNYYSNDIFSKKSKIMILASKKIQNINFINL
jgi:hypothetical protein